MMHKPFIRNHEYFITYEQRHYFRYTASLA